MLEVFEDLRTLLDLNAPAARHVKALCIPTNGETDRKGRAVMGRGVAQLVRNAYPTVAYVLGDELRMRGHLTRLLTTEDEDDNPVLLDEKDMPQRTVTHLISFPTKQRWRDPASIDLIKGSAHALVELIHKHANLRGGPIYLPRPGCRAGGLRWRVVKPILEPILDDRFVIIERSPHRV